jgi:hypothetical protein
LGAGSRVSELSHLLAEVWKELGTFQTVMVFSWRLLLDRIPTHAKLHVFSEAAGVVFALYRGCLESVDHLFVLCGVASKVWYGIHRWLRWE